MMVYVFFNGIYTWISWDLRLFERPFDLIHAINAIPSILPVANGRSGEGMGIHILEIKWWLVGGLEQWPLFFHIVGK